MVSDEPIGPQPRVTKVDPPENACWDAKPCEEGKTCWLGELPCGPAGCQKMRDFRDCSQTGSELCDEHETCMMRVGLRNGVYPLCAQTVCTADQDCRSSNLECVDNKCVNRACTANDDCDGYCINGYCTATAGRCLDPAELKVP